MKHKLLTCLVAGVVGASVALASPAMARGGGGFGGGHGGGFGGGHGGFAGGMHAMGGGGMHFGGMGGMGGARFGGAHFAGPRFAHAAFAPRFSHAAFSPRFAHAAFAPRFAHRPFFRHRFFHHRRFAFIGAPFLYASYYDGCWRRVWTAYGLQWVNVCGDYGYYGY